MPKMVLSYEEAEEILVKKLQEKNPDVTGVVIEGMFSEKEVNKLLAEANKGAMVSVSSRTPIGKKPLPTSSEPEPQPEGPRDPQPTDPEMQQLVQSLQLVTESGNMQDWEIKFLKGKNTNLIFTISKGLEKQCEYCGYFGLTAVDVEEHQKVYHKNQWKARQAKEKELMDKSRKVAQEKVASQAVEPAQPRWGKGRDKS